MSETETPKKNKKSLKQTQKTTASHKFGSTGKSSHINSKAQRNGGTKSIRPSAKQRWHHFILKQLYKQSVKKVKRMETQRVHNLPKNVAQRKRQRARTYDRIRREQSPQLHSSKLLKPFKPKYAWNKQPSASKRLMIDQVCKRHREEISMSYDDLKIKMDNYAKMALKKVQRQKKNERKQKRKLSQRLKHLQEQQHAIISATGKKRLVRSNSDLQKAFT